MMLRKSRMMPKQKSTFIINLLKSPNQINIQTLHSILLDCSSSFHDKLFLELKHTPQESFILAVVLQLIIMSREEIERILNSDLTQLDHSIDAKIHNIDQISGQLSEKSNFLAEFQLLLQMELGKQIPPPTVVESEPQREAPQTVQSTTKQVQQRVQQFSKNGKQMIEYSSDKMRSILREEYCLKKDQNTIQQFIYPYVPQQKQQPRLNYQQLNAIKMEIGQVKQLFTFVKQEIKGQIQFFKANILHTVQVFIFEAFARFKQQYQQQIKDLNQQIYQLKESSNRKPIIKNPLMDVSLHKLNEQYSLDFKQNLMEFEMSKVNSLTIKNTPPNNVLNSQKWQTQRLSLREDTETPTNSRSQSQSFALPEIKVLSVGVPPIKNGFGILKTGSKVIYRGMWKDGKFDGSGQLVWDDYCYQGLFLKGCFEGHGRLQMKNMTYVGKFEGNRACGEGTLEMVGKKIVGIWIKNVLVRQF